jgi:hypothetical protein
MQMGTALFLGLALVAIVILYHSTKDRWNWKKIAKKILIIPIVAVGLGLIVWIYFFVEEKIKDFPTKQIELGGIKIGDLKEDILFKKGISLATLSDEELMNIAYPDKIKEAKRNGYTDQEIANFLAEKRKKKDVKEVRFGKDVLEFPKNMSDKEIKEAIVKEYGFEDFLQYGELQIFIIKNRASLIQKTCDVYQSLNGIQCGGSVKDLESKLGKSKLVTCSRDHLRRIYHYPNYQVAYGLTQNSVTEFIVYDNTLGKVVEAEGFEDC